jgi:hypothetical protein
MNLFRKNLNYYAKVAPAAAVKLPYINADHYQFCKTEKGEENLCLKLPDQEKFFHAQSGAAEEARSWFATLDLHGKEILYVFGVGLGYYYDAAKEWLKSQKSHRLIFLENDPAVLCKFFETERAHRLLHDKQVQLHLFQGVEFEQDKMIFDRLSWSFLNQPFLVSALRYYSVERKEAYSQVAHKIPYNAAYNSDYVVEFMHHGVAFYRNFYRNLLQIPGSYLGNKLFGKFKKVPAIICGAGPSLQKQLPLLKTLSEKALIFTGGSSLNALGHEGVIPHFGAGVDPNDEQYKRLISNVGFEVPFFYRSRMNHKAFMTIHGPKLYLTGSGAYQTANWFDQKLKLKGENLDEGNNVVNFLLDVAISMGCDPIIFVGVDLSYTGMQAYAPGVIENAAIKQTDLEKDNAFLKEDIDGNKVYTLWKWIAESEWIGKYAAEHPKLRIINATEGGIGFPGVPNLSLKEVEEKYLKKSYDLRSRVHGEIQNATVKTIEVKKVIRLMHQFAKSLQRTSDLFDQLLQEEEAIRQQMKSYQGKEEIPQSGVIALIENELSAEPAYEFAIDLFNQMYLRNYYREVEKISLLKKKGPPAKAEPKRIAFNKKRYQFLKMTANVNQFLLLDAIDKFEKGE